MRWSIWASCLAGIRIDTIRRPGSTQRLYDMPSVNVYNQTKTLFRLHPDTVTCLAEKQNQAQCNSSPSDDYAQWGVFDKQRKNSKSGRSIVTESRSPLPTLRQTPSPTLFQPPFSGATRTFHQFPINLIHNKFHPHLLESNVLGLFTESLTRHVQPVLANDAAFLPVAGDSATLHISVST